ncbi:hypothetical protein ANTPLA_LOCUS7374 [Anthophora plagiata]
MGRCMVVGGIIDLIPNVTTNNGYLEERKTQWRIVYGSCEGVDLWKSSAEKGPEKRLDADDTGSPPDPTPIPGTQNFRVTY